MLFTSDHEEPRDFNAIAGRPRQHHPLRQMQLQRWKGQGYVRFGTIIEGADL